MSSVDLVVFYCEHRTVTNTVSTLAQNRAVVTMKYSAGHQLIVSKETHFLKIFIFLYLYFFCFLLLQQTEKNCYIMVGEFSQTRNLFL